jgi:hypothetical protein
MFNDTIAGNTFLSDTLKHSRSFPARLKAEELLRRTRNEDVRREEKKLETEILFDSPLDQSNRNTPTEIPGSRESGVPTSLMASSWATCQSVWRTSVHERQKYIKLASCASRCPVTSALRKWRQYI